MKEDDTQPLEAVTDEVSEARIVAWVLGEASAFEIAELERLCAEKPELEVFHRRMLALQGLLVETVGGDHDDAAWKLPEHKRQGLADAPSQAAALGQPLISWPRKRSRWEWVRGGLGIAAGLMSALIVWKLYQPQEERGAYGALGLSEPKEMTLAGSPDPLESPGGDRLKRAIDAQEQKVEESRKALSRTVGEKQIVYRGDESIFGAAAPPAQQIVKSGEPESEVIARGIGTGDYMGARRDLEAEISRLESMKEKAAVVSPSGAGGSANFGLGTGDGFASNAPAEPQPEKPRSNARARIVPPQFAENSPPAAASAPAAGAAEGQKQKSARAGLDEDLGGTASKDSMPPMGTVATAARPSAETIAPAAPVFDTVARGDFRMENMDAMAQVAGPADPFAAGAPASGGLYYRLESPKELDIIDLFAKNERSSGSGLDLIEPLVETVIPPLPAAPAQALAPDEKEMREAAEAKPTIEEMNFDEIQTAEEAFSTFSLSVSDVSFQLAKAALERGEQPDPASIKVEQFYNAVDYGDPSPESGEPVAGVVEQAAHPVIPGRNLVRLGIRTAATGRGQSQPLRLTLLIDQSGSMVREDRKAAMTKAIDGLAGLMTEADQVSVIGFSRTPKLLVEAVPGNGLGARRDLINPEAGEGGTNLEEAMKLARTIATRHQLAGAQNRIVLFTDGAANLGDADPARLAGLVTAMRRQGLAFDVAGIGAEGLNDQLLANLARHGNGRYYVAADHLAAQLAGAFRPAAEDVKVQVKFNPERVSRYKLIGFEESRLKTEDFRDDTIDAAELAAEEAAVAVYQVELIPDGKGVIGEMNVRFREAGSGGIVERAWTISHDDDASAFDRASPSMQLAGLSMLAGQKLRGGPLADAIDFRKLSGPVPKVKQYYSGSSKAADMLRVVRLLSK